MSSRTSGDPLLGGQLGQRRLHVERGVGVGARRRAPTWRRCSGSGTVGRACRRRTRSRQALTTMRCSQVVTADVAAEPVGRPVRREQRVLDRVGGLLAVAEGAQGDRPQPVAVPADQLAERVRVAGDVGAQQGGVVAVLRSAPVTARPYRAGSQRIASRIATVTAPRR